MVSSAIATLLAVDGSRISAPTMASTAAMPQPPASQASLPSPKRAATNAIEQRKRRRHDSGRMQPDPVLAELGEQRCGRDGEHEGDQQHRDAVGDDRRKHDQRHQHQQAEVLRVPAPGQGEAAAADHRREHQADRRGDPVVDRGDRDDVHIRRRDTGRGEGDRADPPARAGVTAGAATPTSAPASRAPAPTRISGRRMPAWAASTSSSTTPMSVTATPATARTLPIQLASRGGRGAFGARRRGHWAAGGGGSAVRRRVHRGGRHVGLWNGHRRWHRMRCGLRRDGRSASRRSSSVRSAETLANCSDIAAKFAESRETTA